MAYNPCLHSLYETDMSASSLKVHEPVLAIKGCSWSAPPAGPTLTADNLKQVTRATDVCSHEVKCSTEMQVTCAATPCFKAKNCMTQVRVALSESMTVPFQLTALFFKTEFVLRHSEGKRITPRFKYVPYT